MFKTAYGEKLRVGLQCNDKSLAVQSSKNECDINFIVGRFKKTGVLQHARAVAGDYGDFEAIDFQDALHVVMRGREAFAALPAKIRNQFENDPAQFLAFATDPANEAEMVALGLKDPPPEKIAPVAPAPASEGV